jgi:hypothetical protein
MIPNPNHHQVRAAPRRTMPRPERIFRARIGVDRMRIAELWDASGEGRALGCGTALLQIEHVCHRLVPACGTFDYAELGAAARGAELAVGRFRQAAGDPTQQAASAAVDRLLAALETALARD